MRTLIRVSVNLVNINAKVIAKFKVEVVKLTTRLH